MNKQSKIVLAAAVILTIASVVIWQATGGDWYTKYEVVEQVESKADPNDPLVAAGFYEGGKTTETVTRDEFRFGLLPTPAGIFDKHALSVASVVGPAWGIAIGFLWIGRRKRRL
jgi:hypothetical protein